MRSLSLVYCFRQPTLLQLAVAMQVQEALVTPAPEVPNTRGPEVAHILVLGDLDIPGREVLITRGLAAVHTQAPEALAVAHTQVLEDLVMPGRVGLVMPAPAAVHILAPAVAVAAQECVANATHRLTRRSKGRAASGAPLSLNVRPQEYELESLAGANSGLGIRP